MRRKQSTGFYIFYSFLLRIKFHWFHHFNRFFRHADQNVVISEGVRWTMQVLSYTFPTLFLRQLKHLTHRWLGNEILAISFQGLLVYKSGFWISLYNGEYLTCRVKTHCFQLKSTATVVIPIYQAGSFSASHKSVFNRLTSRWHHKTSHLNLDTMLSVVKDFNL